MKEASMAAWLRITEVKHYFVACVAAAFFAAGMVGAFFDGAMGAFDAAFVAGFVALAFAIAVFGDGEAGTLPLVDALP